MNLEHEKAFDPFYDEIAIVTGTRSESGAARALKLTVPVSLSIELAAPAGQSAVSPVIENQYTLGLRRSDWGDPQPPQAGDAVSIDNYPTLRVSAVLPDGTAGWTIVCMTKETAL